MTRWRGKFWRDILSAVEGKRANEQRDIFFQDERDEPDEKKTNKNDVNDYHFDYDEWCNDSKGNGDRRDSSIQCDELNNSASARSATNEGAKSLATPFTHRLTHLFLTSAHRT